MSSPADSHRLSILSAEEIEDLYGVLTSPRISEQSELEIPGIEGWYSSDENESS